MGKRIVQWSVTKVYFGEQIIARFDGRGSNQLAETKCYMQVSEQHTVKLGSEQNILYWLGYFLHLRHGAAFFMNTILINISDLLTSKWGERRFAHCLIRP